MNGSFLKHVKNMTMVVEWICYIVSYEYIFFYMNMNGIVSYDFVYFICCFMMDTLW